MGLLPPDQRRLDEAQGDLGSGRFSERRGNGERDERRGRDEEVEGREEK